MDVLNDLNDLDIEIYKVGIGTTVSDKYITISAPIIIKHKTAGRFIGINPDTGEFLGDPFGWNDVFNNIVETVVQRYIARVIIKKLQKLGYSVAVQQTENAIVGVGVRT